MTVSIPVPLPLLRPTAMGFVALIFVSIACASEAQTLLRPSPPPPWDGAPAGDPLRLSMVAPSTAVFDYETLEAHLNAVIDLHVLGVDSLPNRPNFDVALIAPGAIEMNESEIEYAKALSKKGVGIVWVAYENTPGSLDSLIAEAIRVEPPPGFARGLLPTSADVRFLDREGSRIAVIEYPSPAPFTHALVARSDARTKDGYRKATAVVIRALLWAAEREADTRIAGAELFEIARPEDAQIPPNIESENFQSLLAAPGTATMSTYALRFDPPLEQAAEIAAIVRYPEREMGWRYAMQTELPRATAESPIQLPTGPAAQRIDFQLTRRGRTVDWYTIEAPARVPRPRLEAVSFSRTRLHATDSLRANAEIAADPMRGVNGTAHLRVVDRSGRIRARSATPFGVEGGPVSVHVDLSRLDTPHVRAELIAAPGVLGTTHWESQWASYYGRDLPVNVVRDVPFNVVVPAPPLDELGQRRHLKSLAESGIHGVLLSPSEQSPDFLGKIGLHAVRASEGFAVLDLSATSAPAAKHALWTAVLDQKQGITLGGLELPGMSNPMDQTDDSWKAVVSVLATLDQGWSSIIQDARVTGRGEISGSKDDVLPETLVNSRSAFRGAWRSFEYGEASIFAVLAAPDARKTRTITARFGEEHHPYWEGSRTPLRPGGRARLSVEPGETALIRALPYEVSRVLVAAPAEGVQGIPLPVSIDIKTLRKLPGDHLVHLELRRAGEGRQPTVSTNLRCANGSGETTIAIAFNEPPGDYLLEATDVLSGTRGVAEIRILRATP